MTEKELKKPTFIHLDVNTEYSIGKSVVRIEQLLDQCLNDEIQLLVLQIMVIYFLLIKFTKVQLRKESNPS